MRKTKNISELEKSKSSEFHLPRLYEEAYEYHHDFRSFVNWIDQQYGNERAFIIKYRDRRKKTTEYETITYSDFAKDIRSFACYLNEKGMLEKPVAVNGKNCYEWILTYISVLYAGGTIVPLDKDLPAKDGITSLKRSGSGVLFYENTKKSPGKITELPAFTFEEIGTLVKEGREMIENGSTGHIKTPIDPAAQGIIIFTSGTSASSKAVLLSQENVLSNAYDAATTEPFYQGEINMAFLPYHHTFGATAQIILLWAGVTTAYCDGLRHVQENLIEYGVSVFVGVPALIDAMYRKIQKNIKKEGKEKKFKRGIAISNFLMKIGIDRRRKIFKEVIDQLGGLRFIILGAAAADPEVLENFNAMGITTVLGYGLTESSPILAAETPELRKTGSVGKAFPSAELKIIDKDENGIGELIARGKGIMIGYLNDPENTDKALKNGWLHTGDLATIDENGFVSIKGRKKNVIVLKNGKNVFPEELEELVQELPFVEEVMVYGEERNPDEPSGGTDLTVTCKIVYKEQVMKEEYGGKCEDDYKNTAKEAIDTINDRLPPHQQIKRIHITDEPMIKTSTGKIKRYLEISKTNK